MTPSDVCRGTDPARRAFGAGRLAFVPWERADRSLPFAARILASLDSKIVNRESKRASRLTREKGIQIFTHCQTGVRASHALFTLKRMGHDSVRNYDGSWPEWGNSKDTAVAQ